MGLGGACKVLHNEFNWGGCCFVCVLLCSLLLLLQGLLCVLNVCKVWNAPLYCTVLVQAPQAAAMCDEMISMAGGPGLDLLMHASNATNWVAVTSTVQ